VIFTNLQESAVHFENNTMGHTLIGGFQTAKGSTFGLYRGLSRGRHSIVAYSSRGHMIP